MIVNTKISIPESVLQFRFSRSSGKGGQNVNKVSTKVELLFDVRAIIAADKVKERIIQNLSHRLSSDGMMSIVSQESRSQWQNKRKAIQKLIELIKEASHEEKDRVPTKKTYASQQRRVEKKKKEGAKKNLRRRKDFDAE